MTTWGLSATIKAPTQDILQFAAHHLDLGAHRLYLYLDDPESRAHAPLKAHPKIRVARCDSAHWTRLCGQRPRMHQARQTANATHAYGRKPEVDWLIHIDVDEFLWPRQDRLGDLLGALAPSTLTARVRPIEALAGSERHFKAFIPPGPERGETVTRLYPDYAAYVRGGFLSHVAGKVFVRTGLGALDVRIHNVFRNGEQNPSETELDAVRLCHCHARDWDRWLAAFRYRHEKGAYRATLPPATADMPSLHMLLARIMTDEGEAGLRRFFDTICADTPAHRARLDAEGLLEICDLQLGIKQARHFPGSPLR